MSLGRNAALLFVLDRDEGVVNVLDPTSGRTVASVETTESPDYVRFVPSTQELWVTEPAGSSPGIEIFAVPDDPAPTPRRVAPKRHPQL